MTLAQMSTGYFWFTMQCTIKSCGYIYNNLVDLYRTITSIIVCLRYEHMDDGLLRVHTQRVHAYVRMYSVYLINVQSRFGSPQLYTYLRQ